MRAVEALDFLRTLCSRDQQDQLKRFREIAAFRSNFSDFVEYDSSGRRVDVHVLSQVRHQVLGRLC